MLRLPPLTVLSPSHPLTPLPFPLFPSHIFIHLPSFLKPLSIPTAPHSRHTLSFTHVPCLSLPIPFPYSSFHLFLSLIPSASSLSTLSLLPFPDPPYAVHTCLSFLPTPLSLSPSLFHYLLFFPSPRAPSPFNPLPSPLLLNLPHVPQSPHSLFLP